MPTGSPVSLGDKGLDPGDTIPGGSIVTLTTAPTIGAGQWQRTGTWTSTSDGTLTGTSGGDVIEATFSGSDRDRVDIDPGDPDDPLVTGGGNDTITTGMGHAPCSFRRSTAWCSMDTGRN